MDKNMIRIDDLLKQRLSGGEEKERPGSWMAMRDLLDQNMPQRVAGSYNWRRIFFYSTGALLLAALTVGGYKTITSIRSNDAGVMSANVVSSNTSTNSFSKNTNAINTTDNNSTENNQNNNDNQLNKTVVVANNIPAKKSEDRKAVTDNKSTINALAKTGSKTIKQNQPNTIAKAANTVPANSVAKATNNNVIEPAPANTAKPNVVSSGNVPANTPTSTSEPVNNTKSELSASSVNANSKAGDKLAKANNNSSTPTASGNTKASKTDKPGKNNNNNPVAKNNDADKNNVAKNNTDYIKKQERRNKNGELETDTIEQGKTTWPPVDETIASAEKTMAANTDEAAHKTKHVEVLPSAGLMERADDGAPMLPLSEKMVDRKKHRGGKWSDGLFEEMVKSAKLRFTGVNFYPGVTFGANYALAKNSDERYSGFQLGLVGLTTLSDHWSILTELKYQHRFNRGNTVNDDYNRNLQSTYMGTSTMYSWDSVEHYFKYSTLGSMHLPVAVRYAVNRLSMFAGANFAYNFKVGVEDVGNPNPTSQKVENGQGGLRYYNMQSDYPSVEAKDFGPRFEIGAIAGFSYDVSPAVRLDLRYLQGFWNNATDNGKLKVYEELYSHPSLQFNLNYRFSSNKYKRFSK